MFDRITFDLDSYVRRIQSRPCFICELVAGRPGGNVVICQGPDGIAFLNKYPTLYRYTLVAPLDHRANVTGDFTVDEYVDLQRLAYRVAEAVRAAVSPERMYILSLGSKAGNSHVHWHIAPLPPGVPSERQQLSALDAREGILQIPESDMEELAERIRERLGAGGA